MTNPAARQTRAPKFRDDIDPANTWIVSDTHFGHANIVGFCLRPEDHEQAMIAEWRKEVPDTGRVLHLGDLNYGQNARFKNLVAKELTGVDKIIIQGNHDHQRYSFYKASGFNIVSPFKITYGGEEKCPFCKEGRMPPVYEGDSDYECNQCHGSGTRSVEPWVISFSHYPWNEAEEGPMPSRTIRVHGHIHNNGYTREAYVPFLKNHINLSVEQTHYKPVNLKLLLDAYLFGEYPETTQAQQDEARERRQERKQSGSRN